MTPSHRPRCWQCRAILELIVGQPVGRSETCPECDADIRACRSCAHWDQGTRTCREPTAEPPPDPERRNFCGAFQLGSQTPSEAPLVADVAAEARRRLEALFSKK